VYAPVGSDITVDGDLFYDNGAYNTGSVSTLNADGTWSWVAIPDASETVKGIIEIATAAEVARPVAEPHADWMWYQSIPAPGAAAGASFSTAQALGGPIRIRARRRMDELGMRLWFVADSNGLTAYDLLVSTSVLLIMP